MALEIGVTAKVVVPTIQGTIIDTTYDKSSKSLSHLLEWQEAGNPNKQRWFTEAELQEVPAAPAPEAP